MTAKRIKKAAILVCAGFMALSLPGVGSTALGAPSNRETRIQEETWGRVFLSAGPKISLSYDREGEVLEAKGLNQDGRKLLEGAGNFAGADCDTAVRRLVKRMDDRGWFRRDKNEKELVIESEKGSVYPRADFMKEIEEAAWEAVNKNGIDITITLKDNGKQSEQLYIGKNEAKRIAIKELGLKENELTYKGCELDDGVYELRFLVNGRKLEVDVNAATGRIADVDWDNDAGAWDDDRFDD
ncbi:MAG: PepSY domain-containing protein [Enterocloster bolteae]